MRMSQSDRWFAKSPPGFCEPSEHMRRSFEESHLSTYSRIGWTEVVNRMPPNSYELFVKQTSNVQYWQRTNGVTVFPSADIVEKCLHTESLSGVAGSDILTSFPTVMFTLPSSCAFTRPGVGPIGHLLVSVHEPDTPLISYIDTVPVELRMPEGRRHLLITAFWSHHFVNNFSIPLEDRPIRETLLSMRDFYIADDLRLAGMDEAERRREEEETSLISEWANSLVINFMLLMQSYPQFITHMGGKYDRPHVYRDSPRPLSYTLSRSRSLLPPPVHENGPPGLIGRHISPQAHWRRGHWRRQPHLPGWYAAAEARGEAPQEIALPDGRKAHMVWIEPVFVGIKERPEVQEILEEAQRRAAGMTKQEAAEGLKRMFEEGPDV